MFRVYARPVGDDDWWRSTPVSRTQARLLRWTIRLFWRAEAVIARDVEDR